MVVDILTSWLVLFNPYKINDWLHTDVVFALHFLINGFGSLKISLLRAWWKSRPIEWPSWLEHLELPVAVKDRQLPHRLHWAKDLGHWV
jgi:hypothetical protein